MNPIALALRRPLAAIVAVIVVAPGSVPDRLLIWRRPVHDRGTICGR
jgi:hypothetical protein